ncbi:hypothetical protein XENOCAPTIV_026554 [Xenoophorus captivus]|uniref:Uncharacterized protein n=1 Tax=Xenoophorus captivus TaxID=1517983 RepID=A0ABV0S8Q5_9TELE
MDWRPVQGISKLVVCILVENISIKTRLVSIFCIFDLFLFSRMLSFCYDSGPSACSALTHAINSSASPAYCCAITVMPHTCGAAVIYIPLTGRRCQIFENICE